MNTQKALFFSPEGCLIRPRNEGDLFPKGIDDWTLIPYVAESIRPFVEAGYMFILISNQGGIEAGMFTAEQVEAKLIAVLVALSHALELYPPTARYAFRYCGSRQEHPDRKPNPGMVLDAIRTYGIDAQASCSVGDMETDYQAFSAAGIRDYFSIGTFLATKPRPVLSLYQ